MVEESGMSQKSVAKALDMRPSYLSALLNGLNNLNPKKAAEILVKGLGLDEKQAEEIIKTALVQELTHSLEDENKISELLEGKFVSVDRYILPLEDILENTQKVGVDVFPFNTIAGKDCFTVKASASSCGGRIEANDTVLIAKGSEITEEGMYLFNHKGSSYFSYLYQEDDLIQPKQSSIAFPPLRPESILIMGKVITIVKHLQ